MRYQFILTITKSEAHNNSSSNGQSVGHKQTPSSHLAPCLHWMPWQGSEKNQIS